MPSACPPCAVAFAFLLHRRAAPRPGQTNIEVLCSLPAPPLPKPLHALKTTLGAGTCLSALLLCTSASPGSGGSISSHCCCLLRILFSVPAVFYALYWRLPHTPLPSSAGNSAAACRWAVHLGGACQCCRPCDECRLHHPAPLGPDPQGVLYPCALVRSAILALCSTAAAAAPRRRRPSSAPRPTPNPAQASCPTCMPWLTPTHRGSTSRPSLHHSTPPTTSTAT